ncbi:hypothetical protein [Flavihumibacter petaseus]|uniref:Uncharacterized protein n=1 Tax=Flavihumibacter petaseus NBRC 106054 TaxID=1220578 RepID=A0A0E9N1G3_9BACT|nr:hypothetical protein [Flavihumibacter petaseus]GAO43466.1 hypothetical protein FPE01S_02_05710 [Flavihumibacter petaseus NBRC 106054]
MKTLFVILLCCSYYVLPAQKNKTAATVPAYDSIAFHLYTDSLKRNVHNYINVDARLVGGGWYPLTQDQLVFSCPQGRFEGNSLIIDSSFTGPFVNITVKDRRNPKLELQRDVYIKTLPDNEILKTEEEVLNGKRGSKPPRRKN